MPDIFLYAGEPTPTDIRLSDPTVLRGGGGGPTIIEADAASAGIGAATGIAAALWNGLGASAGLATGTGTAAGIWNGQGASAGLAAVTGVSAAIFTGVGTSDGLGSGSGVGAAGSASVGDSAGIASTTGFSTAVYGSAGTSNGVATGTGTSVWVFSSVGASAGQAIALGETENAFPTQYDGLRVYTGVSTVTLCLVAEADAPGSMGGVMKLNKNDTLYAVYLVETSDPNASPYRIRTSTGTKAIREKT